MILGFKTKFDDGTDTAFGYKILNGLLKANLIDQATWESFIDTLWWNGYPLKDLKYNDLIDLKPKLTTIRQDALNRWKADKLIHFAHGVRTSNYRQFAPTLPCVSTQEIAISHKDWRYPPIVTIDGDVITSGLMEQLSINDGFESAEDFFAWFSTDFTGKIIHWTDLKY